MTEFAVSVRDLVAFCHRSGDIDHRYTPAPTAEQGVAGHERVYRRRGASYQREFAVSYRFQRDDHALLLRGRADGYDREAGLLEEIKTCRGDPANIPPAVSRLHLAQARIYAAIIAAEENLPALDVRLTWLDIDTEQEHPLSQRYTREELQMFLQDTLQRFSRWLSLLSALREQRNASLQQLAFPHGEFRPGQRDIAELVYKCVDQGGQLMLEAPTGIGKTVAVLYPALKAMATGKHDALAFVTSRTVGRRAAEQTLELMTDAGLRACSVSLTAKESACLSPGSACHGDDCPYARGYYDRLGDAMTAAVQGGVLGREKIESIARAHSVCPYQLAFDLLPWVDIVVADVHYVYSLQPLLGRLMQESRRWTVLQDEAHNLPERARTLYSAHLAKAALMQVKRSATGDVRKTLQRLNRALLALQKEPWAEQSDSDVRDTLPANLLTAMGEVIAAVVGAMAEDPRFAPANPALMDFFFALLQWLRVAEQWDEEYRFELLRGDGSQGLQLTLNCLDPSRLLAQCHARAHSVVVFSATLSPREWMRQILGLDGAAVCRRLHSPFQPQQLLVEVETGIDTRYRQREASAGQLAARISRFLGECAGNCIVYFPSYHYLRATLSLLKDTGGLAGRLCWEQYSEMDETARNGLFSALAESNNVAAFCILGGVFAEGIDLPGDLLSGVAVVGVGMPQVGRERELLREWYQRAYGQGFEYAYVYPAMQKVDQALGRVVRTDNDSGRALLVDVRYGQRLYRELLPPWWSYADSRTAQG
ncbi:ATP-dependent DNA helicase [Pseudohalioglobus sediminis]|uniref:ATP-dependent DNA helicase n=1 Tax=Pseudohalioglobus sediminis TaxID=2606449 RepID=A0A5B0WRY1_9GAMM|nr:ATP-dependent DNA helicase [Pseudohalioglobus sediminis]KAA1189764.1 ATP-dependent DNA helicase [Pseudohalioglobus sediminis]